MVTADQGVTHHEALRQATASHHQVLEEVTRLPGTLRSREDLADLLETFHAYYRVVEPGLIDRTIWQRHALPHCRISLVEQLSRDLHHLGRTAAASRSRQPPAPTIDSDAAVWGVAYVLQGATLGGQIITKHLRRNGILDDTLAQQCFFNLHGNETGRLWRQFVAALDALELSDAEQAAMLQAACTTFDTLTSWCRKRHGE